jgi:hypothetical protein
MTAKISTKAPVSKPVILGLSKDQFSRSIARRPNQFRGRLSQAIPLHTTS